MIEKGEFVIISKSDFEHQKKTLEILYNQLMEIKQLLVQEGDNSKEWGNNWHSLKFVSEKLGVEKSSLTYWSRTGKIDKKKIGDKIFINIAQVYDLLNFEEKSDEVVPQLNPKKKKVA